MLDRGRVAGCKGVNDKCVSFKVLLISTANYTHFLFVYFSLYVESEVKDYFDGVIHGVSICWLIVVILTLCCLILTVQLTVHVLALSRCTITDVKLWLAALSRNSLVLGLRCKK